MWIFLLGCAGGASDNKDSGAPDTVPAELVAGYGPDCSAPLVLPSICACEVSIDWSRLTSSPASIGVFVIAGEAQDVAEAMCDEALTQSQVRWSQGYLPADQTSVSVDFSAYEGQSGYAHAIDDAGVEIAYVLFDLTATSTSATVTLQ